jgi:hypothetical protein
MSLARTSCCLEPQGVHYAPSDARLWLLLGLKDRLEFFSSYDLLHFVAAGAAAAAGGISNIN